MCNSTIRCRLVEENISAQGSGLVRAIAWQVKKIQLLFALIFFLIYLQKPKKYLFYAFLLCLQHNFSDAANTREKSHM